MKILITGSSGTVGTALCEKLEQVHELIPVDIRPNQWNKRIGENTTLMDLRSGAGLEKLPHGIDLVVHLAANARVYDLVVAPDLAFDNIITTYNVLEYIRKKEIPRIIFASSREVYGSAETADPIPEEMVDITRCESPYTASKIAGEAMIYSYANVYKLNAAIVRLSNVYGRYDDSNRVVPSWIRSALSNESLCLYGPQKELDFTYLDDAVDGINKLIEKFDSVQGLPINLSYGSKESLLSVAKMIIDMTNSESELIFENSRPGELWTYQADLTRAKSLLGYSPQFDIETGLKLTVDWYIDWLGSQHT